MSLTISSYIPTAAGTDARTQDQLSYTFSARPQAMTVYVRFIESGTAASGTTNRIWQIGTSNNSNPRTMVFNSSGAYTMQHINLTGTTVTATLAAGPAVGDIVELLAELGADGSVTLSQSLNGATATATATSSGISFGTTWGTTPLLTINSIGTAAVGYNAFMNVVAIRGVHSLARMRRFAGVKQ